MVNYGPYKDPSLCRGVVAGLLLAACVFMVCYTAILSGVSEDAVAFWGSILMEFVVTLGVLGFGLHVI